jgi:hypothetical protein
MMHAPHNSIIDLQLAAITMSADAVTRATEFWIRLTEAQMHVLGGPPGERRNHVEIAQGPTFHDHYGRRLHDIDPEHDV